jgi:hypothetical protein
MNRPSRQLKHLDQKLANKSSRRAPKGDAKGRPVGAKEKRWKKSAELYRPLVEGAPAAEG